jgi:hypothetical protein
MKKLEIINRTPLNKNILITTTWQINATLAICSKILKYAHFS